MFKFCNITGMTLEFLLFKIYFVKNQKFNAHCLFAICMFSVLVYWYVVICFQYWHQILILEYRRTLVGICALVHVCV